jgi:16S rRNA (guanine527-N7)-methyltransferase
LSAADTLADPALARLLDAGLDELGVVVPAAGRDLLLAYVALLAKWSRIYNLTAIREPAKVVTHHLLDSLSVLPAIDAHLGARNDITLLDIGSGAGLPGVPIAVARPAWRISMVEPVHKKAAFIAQAIAELALGNASVSGKRIEEHTSTPRADVVVSRAFSDLASFASVSAPHLAAGGRIVAMKGVHPDEELAELPARFAVADIVALRVPGIDAARHLVFIEPVRT